MIHRTNLICMRLQCMITSSIKGIILQNMALMTIHLTKTMKASSRHIIIKSMSMATTIKETMAIHWYQHRNQCDQYTVGLPDQLSFEHHDQLSHHGRIGLQCLREYPDQRLQEQRGHLGQLFIELQGQAELHDQHEMHKQVRR